MLGATAGAREIPFAASTESFAVVEPSVIAVADLESDPTAIAIADLDGDFDSDVMAVQSIS